MNASPPLPTRGRWVRRGREVVLLPGGPGPATGMEAETGPIPATTQGVIHPAIDVHAQYALMRLSKGDPGAQADAWGMLGEARAGRLGIYKVDQQKPALRAKKLGGSWWTVIPAGEDAAVLADPSSPAEPPFIVFRDAVKSDASRLDPALRKAWRTVGLLGGCVIPVPGGGRQAFAEPLGRASVAPANLFPRMLCQAGGGTPPQTLPAGLTLLTHLHVPMIGVGAAPAPPPVPMTTPAMNPGFIDPATGAAAKDPAAGGLNDALQRLVERRYRARAERMSIALVDLTGPRFLAPEFAGWRETVPVTGASTPKICISYAVHQLRLELQALAASMPGADYVQVAGAMRAAWRAQGLVLNQPDLTLFTFGTTGPPRTVVPAGTTTTLLRCTFTVNEGRAASLLMERIGLPYLSSLLWQSGLFHPVQGGMWHTNHYGGECEHGVGTGCCFMDQQLPRRLPGAVEVTPRANTSHNLTALSAATFFTLLAQGRLGDAVTSRAIGADLVPACTYLQPRLLSCPSMPAPHKCGIWNGFAHDAALVSRPGGLLCRTGTLLYAVAVTTRGFLFSGAQAQAFMRPLLVDLDRLVLANNP